MFYLQPCALQMPPQIQVPKERNLYFDHFSSRGYIADIIYYSIIRRIFKRVNLYSEVVELAAPALPNRHAIRRNGDFGMQAISYISTL